MGVGQSRPAGRDVRRVGVPGSTGGATVAQQRSRRCPEQSGRRRLWKPLLDGVLSEGGDGSITFHEATHLTADDVLRLERTLQRRVLRLFQRRGLLDEGTVENMLPWQASGGFSLDASVRIHGSQ